MKSGLQPVVSVSELTKRFGSVRALDGVNLDLVAGEVHGIVGENGAGKSTLMKILAGVQQPTSGQMLVRGEAIRFQSVQDALQVGIVMIHQELNLVDELSVADNIFLGREPVRFGLIDRGRCASEARALLGRIGHELDPARLVYSLSIADKQMVEIAKAISYHANVLIMDEPTATLTERDALALLELIGQLRSNGVSIVFISHILPQVLEVSDRITVLRDGRVVTTLEKDQVTQTTERELASLMVGRPMAEYFPPRKPHGDRVVLSVENLSVPLLAHDIDFEVRQGEIFGLAGLIGAGRTETAEAIVGLRRRSSGTLRLDGKTITIDSPVDATRLGIAYLPEDRKDAGLTLGMDVVDNTTMVSMSRYGRVLIDRRGQEGATQAHVRRLRIRAGALTDAVSTLSGGNQQKVLLAKWLEIAPRVLIVDEPTRGVDIGAKEEIYHLLHDLAAQGMTCIMISSEMNELLGMCHRIGVMRSGRLVTILDGESATEDQIIHAAGLEATAAVPS
jgi:ribose transport system ATP-binding protein